MAHTVVEAQLARRVEAADDDVAREAGETLLRGGGGRVGGNSRGPARPSGVARVQCTCTCACACTIDLVT